MMAQKKNVTLKRAPDWRGALRDVTRRPTEGVAGRCIHKQYRVTTTH